MDAKDKRIAELETVMELAKPIFVAVKKGYDLRNVLDALQAASPRRS